MRNTKFSNVILFLSLVLVLVVCSFLILYYEVSAYQKVNNDNERIDNAHFPAMYLSNKMRSAKGIEVEDNKLIIENDKTETVIYLYKDNLLELTTLKGYEIDEAAGEKLFSMDEFNVEKDNDMIQISYTVSDVNSNVVYKLRGEGNE